MSVHVAVGRLFSPPSALCQHAGVYSCVFLSADHLGCFQCFAIACNAAVLICPIRTLLKSVSLTKFLPKRSLVVVGTWIFLIIDGSRDSRTATGRLSFSQLPFLAFARCFSSFSRFHVCFSHCSMLPLLPEESEFSKEREFGGNPWNSCNAFFKYLL